MILRCILNSLTDFSNFYNIYIIKYSRKLLWNTTFITLLQESDFNLDYLYLCWFSIILISLSYISRRTLQDTVDLISTIIRVGVHMRNTKCQSTTSITTLMKYWPRIKTLGYSKMMTSNIICTGKTITRNCISSY